MILQRLAEHYDRIVAAGGDQARLAPPGSSLQKISFCVVLETDGRLNTFRSEQQPSGKSFVATMMVVPGAGKPSGQGINPCFLWDNPAYLLGWSADPEKAERARLTFAAFRDRHLALEGELNHPVFSAVCAFLRNWTPEQAEEHAEVLTQIATNFGVFRVAGEARYVHQLFPKAPAKDETRKIGDEAYGICLVSGERDEIARLHEPKIKGVAGAQSAGALLVSFNAPSYESYGKSQSFNAPVGVGTTFRYANALNHLLNQRDRRVSLGDSTVVYWADHAGHALEKSLSSFFEDAAFVDDLAGPEEDKQRLQEARDLMMALRDGTTVPRKEHDDAGTRFFLLGLSPNASRLSIRLWVEADAVELERCLGQHLRDIALVDSRVDRLLTVRRIVTATGRAKAGQSDRMEFDTKAVSPLLAGDLARAVLTGAPYPQTLLGTMLRRIRADGAVAYARVAAIKACLQRNSRLRGNPIEVSPMLNPENTNQAYCCGRAFALLEKIQTDSAGGDLNATIKDRYFSSASTTPSLVFPRLFRLSQHHLAKLDPGPRIYNERRLGEVLSLLTGFPRLLSLEQQGMFVLGYFHQRQDLFTSKKDKKEGANA